MSVSKREARFGVDAHDNKLILPGKSLALFASI
jgi:hypothetical protein